MKKLLFLLAIPLIAASCSGKPTATTNDNSNVQTQTQGRAVFLVTDASADLNNITAVNLTVDKLEAHSNTGPWVTVFSDTKTFDLLKLKQSGLSEVLADVQMATGTYDQIRLHVTTVTATVAGVVTPVKLPSNTLKIVGKLVINENATASMLLDFMLDKSLHITGNGKYILTPVIKLDSKSDAQVSVKSDGSADVRDGTEQENKTVGSDENGDFRDNFQMDANEKLEVTDNDAIHVINSSPSEVAVKISAQQAVKIAIDNSKINSAVSVKLELLNGKKVWHVTGLLSLVPTSVFIDANTGAIVSVQ